MIELVISGGQTGADQAGLRAARASGIRCGGMAPKGWLTEAGPAPWLADYGLSVGGNDI
jgi:Circularly permutated YpsA SLOG family